MRDSTIAMILGGGAGSRLHPLTEDRSKPAVPVGGSYRLIDIPISNCINSDIRRMFVLTQFNSASLNRHIKETYSFDRFSNGFVDILAAEQTKENTDWFQGTADAVRKSFKRLNKHDYEYLMILSGDQLYQLDLQDIIKDHISKNADVTVATIPVVEEDCPGFGIMKVNGKGLIEDFVEKPSLEEVAKWKSELPEKYTSQGKYYLASMGIYVFNKEIIKKLIKENPDDIDFGKQIIPKAVMSDLTVGSFPFGGYWSDIGSIPSYYKANLDLALPLPDFNLYDNENPIYTRSRMLAPTKIFGTTCSNTLIANGCIINAASITNSLIGIRSRIGKDTVIKDSIILGNDYYQSTLNTPSRLDDKDLLGIGKACNMTKTIVDRNVQIGDNVTIIGGDHLEDTETDQYCVRDGIVIIKKRIKIESGTRIGAD
ncbi:MAG: glucose-1-phosphate adenylyltransferase [Chitinophagales bacterium]|nr:glucose-1-phosphate adenylyltransferase [Chitinophagales bacterium]